MYETCSCKLITVRSPDVLTKFNRMPQDFAE
jgi:hypothetical protein